MHLPTPLLLLSLPLTALTLATTTEHILTHACSRKTTAGDTIEVHYTGTLKATGGKFDSSLDRGTPLKFTVGQGQVIQGWDQGLLGMCIGDKRKLTIPPEEGYGERGMGPIPAASTLVFETELVGIQGVEREEAAEVIKGGEGKEEVKEKEL